MPTTSNFGWTTPADTDLVKDGAAAIRTLGNGIDTSLVDLKGGTTGQVLSKASNTDLDFTWSSVDPLTILDAKGDLISASAADTPTRLASSGVNGDVLTVDTSTSTGLKWAAPGGSANWSLVNTGGTALTGATTITVSGISNADKILILIEDASSANAAAFIRVRLNTDTGNNYSQYGSLISSPSTYAASNFNKYSSTGGSSINICRMAGNAGSQASGFLLLSGCNTAGLKIFNGGGGASNSTDNGQEIYNTGGYYSSASVISSISIVSSTGNFDNGTVYVYTSL